MVRLDLQRQSGMDSMQTTKYCCAAGFPRGCDDDALPWAKAAEGGILGTKYPYVVHAEANALLNTNTSNIAGATIYVTMIPCNECAKLLIQAGISEVVYFEVRFPSMCCSAMYNRQSREGPFFFAGQASVTGQ
jgi:deoxycytidylate deaminase